MRLFGFGLRSLLPGIVAILCLGAVGAVAVFVALSFGAYNVSATNPHPKPVHGMLQYVFKRTVAMRAPDEVPEDLDDPGRVLLGGQHYANACAKCHGGPGLGQNPQALAMRPRPQHLASVVDQFSDAELHWILDNGVRFSAMPAWPTRGRDDEIWNVVAFIRQLPQMSAEAYVAMVEAVEPAMPGAAAMAYGDRGPLLDNGIDRGRGQTRYPAEEYAYASPATEWRDFAIEGHPVSRCAACHGADGDGGTTLGHAPNLTVLSAEYITEALENYATGTRRSGIMQIVAANLSADQRAALGRYYDALPDRAATAAALAATGDPALGERIATRGKLTDAVPACVTCHNSSDVGDDRVASMDVPDLAGQSPLYIRQQLDLFAAGLREGGAPWQPMQYIAASLTDEERDGLAAWFSRQEPGTTIERADLLAEANPAEGAAVVEQVCAECHTERGIGDQSGDVPNLTLQGRDYLHQQLWKFRSDRRENSRMRQTARQISEAEIANTAAYFGAMEPVAVPREINAAAAARGAGIARDGLAEAGVPACLTCHNPEASEEIQILPRLHGQNFAYLKKRLDQFAGLTGEDVYGLSPMPGIATRLTDDQRTEVAAWFATQEPLAK